MLSMPKTFALFESVSEQCRPFLGSDLAASWAERPWPSSGIPVCAISFVSSVASSRAILQRITRHFTTMSYSGSSSTTLHCSSTGVAFLIPNYNAFWPAGSWLWKKCRITSLCKSERGRSIGLEEPTSPTSPRVSGTP
ncbi:hypothetical protein RvY_17983-1 [Ramazzottius varieornatus]|uniref:Uncharacterized protein n=1 Tax=Ramazzottius varieornatus TaxID=947166 RepID=A0A1D1W9N3_RAMVA|nr:hypothetical protein RvY_17983-1 [Ramazzottius varieornatus]